MNEETKVPAEVAAIIEQKKIAMQAKDEEDKRKEREAREFAMREGLTKLRELIAEALKSVPEWLHPYDVTELEWDDDALISLHNGYKPNDLWLVFRIPGLAKIQFKREERGENFVNEWRSQQAYIQRRDYGYEYDSPTLGFSGSSYWRMDLEYTLIEAEQQFKDFENKQAEYQKKTEAEHLRAEQESRREVEADNRRASEQDQKESEERILFNIFKDDPVAVNLMKAFLMINQERSTFNAQLEDANETMYSMEERWSRRAADLRRQAEDADRRAQEERSRATDLQSDLYDAESKLKKAQRGW